MYTYIFFWGIIRLTTTWAMGNDFPSFALQKGRGCLDGFLFNCQPIVWPNPIWHLITPAQFKHLRSEHSLGQNSTQSSSTFRPKPKFKRALPSLLFLFDDSDDIQFSIRTALAPWNLFACSWLVINLGTSDTCLFYFLW